MINAFWIIIRKGPSPSDEIWYLNQLKEHFSGRLSIPERLTLIADSTVDISDEYYHAAILIMKSKEWSINVSEGIPSITNYSDKDGYSGFVISWERKKEKQFVCNAPQIEQNNEIITDIDGNKYNTIKIGNQVWMVENLQVTKLNDNSPIEYISEVEIKEYDIEEDFFVEEFYTKRILGIIPIKKIRQIPQKRIVTKSRKIKWSEFTEPGFCNYEHKGKNKIKYGSLYNWHAVNSGKLAPKGWHIPTIEEWKKLEDYLINYGYNWDNTKKANKIAKSLTTKTEWKKYDEVGSIGNDLSKNNLSGFSALPGGCRNRYGSFENINKHGIWWSSTESSSNGAWLRVLYFDEENFGQYGDAKENGFSVRCIKD